MWRVVVARTDDNSTLLSSEISSGPVGPSHLSALSGAPASHHYYPGYPPPPPPPPPPHHATYQPQHTDMRHHEMRPDLRPELRHDMHRPDLRHPQQQDMHQRQDMGQRNEMRHDMTQQQQQQQQHQEMSMRQTNHELTELRPSHELPELKIDGPELRTRDTQNQGHQRNLKRPMSDSDCDDVFSEESGKEPCSSPGGDSCQHASRKRRRGMIEKKRRDRINASLSELRRLVPAAARDPHSGKLEKAEILQLTVEHLRSLRNKGPDGYDSTKLAMDYHAVGWSECASEVGRYLTTMEGLDERDPLRLRVMSHLQSFHREHPSSNSTALPPSASLTSSSTATSYDIPSVSGAMPPGSIPSIGGSGSGSGGGGGGFGWGQYPGQYPQQQHGKPYRPWGAELAY